MPAPSYIDLAIRRQVILERVKSGQVKDFSKIVTDTEKLLRTTLGSLENEVSDMSRIQFEKLLTEIQNDQAAIFARATKKYLEQQSKISVVTMTQELLDLGTTIDLTGTALNDFTKKEIFSKVLARPLQTGTGQADLLEPWIKNFSDTQVKKTSQAIRFGRANGETNQELVRKLVGTKKSKFTDGILSPSDGIVTKKMRRDASTVVRTSTQHVASAARQETWEANPKIIKRYQFLATLDGVTSPICRVLDKQEFDFGKGAIPPVHPNCRSTTIPVLAEKYKFLSKGRTRSSEGGAIDANTTYYDWLKAQDTKTKKEVLGEKRAKLFTDGGLTPQRFKDLQFDKNFEPMTLEQMRKIVPEAFEKAGI